MIEVFHDETRRECKEHFIEFLHNICRGKSVKNVLRMWIISKERFNVCMMRRTFSRVLLASSAHVTATKQ